jgi:murein DD-endopeptidase MepM/ murein hydrolase activator NlpD
MRIPPLLIAVLLGCSPDLQEGDAAERLEGADEVYDRLATAMRVHDPEYDLPLYQTRDTISPVPANLLGIADVRRVADSLLEVLASEPVAGSDSATVRRHGQLIGRLEAMRARVLLLSGDALTIEEARALQNVAPIEPAPTLSLAVEPAAAPPEPPVIGAAPLEGSRGALMIPVRGVSARDLQDTFTQARSEGRVHNAIDIIAPRGTPVVAATDGLLVRFFTSVRGGLTIYQLGTDNRTVYYYAHLDRYATGLTAGDTVRQGTVIGYVGDTGNAAPGNHHLHFAMWLTDDPTRYWDGAALNPYPLLQLAAVHHQELKETQR